MSTTYFETLVTNIFNWLVTEEKFLPTVSKSTKVNLKQQAESTIKLAIMTSGIESKINPASLCYIKSQYYFYFQSMVTAFIVDDYKSNGHDSAEEINGLFKRIRNQCEKLRDFYLGKSAQFSAKQITTSVILGVLEAPEKIVDLYEAKGFVTLQELASLWPGFFIPELLLPQN